MGTIRVLDHVKQCYNGDDGQVIHDLIISELKSNVNEITISFSGVDSVPTSFVNSALIALLSELSFRTIRQHLRFADTNSQINEMIRSRFAFETSKIKEQTAAYQH